MIHIIKNYIPQDCFEEKDKNYMLEAYNIFGDELFSRHPFFHFSASGVVFNETKTKVLFIYHKIYDSWGWMGGHMDGEYDFKNVAIKEIKEESGIENLILYKEDPISIEVLPVWMHIKNNEALSSHLHLNVSYAFIADEQSTLRVNTAETKGVKWIDIDILDDVVREDEMKPIYKKIIQRVIE